MNRNTSPLTARFILFILISAGIISLLIVAAARLARPAFATNSAAHISIEGGPIERISLGTNSLQTAGGSFHPFPSNDNRYVGFISLAENLVSEQNVDNECLPTKSCMDVFWRDQQTNTTIRLSNAIGGMEANHTSYEPFVSADGTLVLFNSLADNMIPNDTNRTGDFFGADAFLWSRADGSFRRVTLNERGEEIFGDSFGYLSGNGKTVVFHSTGNNVVAGVRNDTLSLYKNDLATGTITHIPVTHDGSPMNHVLVNLQTDYAARYIVFTSYASNILPGDNNNYQDIFVHDTMTGITKLVTRSHDGGFANHESGAPMISEDGKNIVFLSHASNIFAGDSNNSTDVFLYNVETEEITLLSKGASGEVANGDSKDPAVCNDGRLVAFNSEATNIVANDVNGERDIFVMDMKTGDIIVVTKRVDGTWQNGRGHKMRLRNDCSGIYFATDADNMIADDTNGSRDLFYRKITYLADITASAQTAPGLVATSDNIDYSIRVENSGEVPVNITYSAAIPANTTYVNGSANAGGSYNSGTNQIIFTRLINGNSTEHLTFSVAPSASLTGTHAITLDGTLTSATQSFSYSSATIINGINSYLPIVTR